MEKVIFDTETTSADKETCRIIQLAIKVVNEEGKVLINKSKIYNPGVPISPSATAVHGITDEMVKDAPRFKDDAERLKKIFEGRTLVGYNILVFDIPVLLNEFEKAGVSLEISGDVIDVMKLETYINPRTLSAVYKRYTGEDMEGAHDAMADVNGTEIVLNHQLDLLTTLRSESEDDGLVKNALSAAGIPEGSADFYGKLGYDDEGFLIYKFGKHNKKRIIDPECKDYNSWVTSVKPAPAVNFPAQIRKLINDELSKNVKKSFQSSTPFNKPLDFGKVNSLDEDLPF